MKATAIARSLRPLGLATGSGAIAGVVSAGLGARLVMKIIALLDPSTEGALTDASATVGEFTIGGTIELLILGTILGAASGLFYLGLRRWLPVPPAWRGMAFGALTLVTVGHPLFDPANADFQIFEPVVVVVALFGALFLVNGILLAMLLDRFHTDPHYLKTSKVPRIAGAAIGLVFILGAFLFAGGTIGLIEDQGTCLSAVGHGKGCAIPAD